MSTNLDFGFYQLFDNFLLFYKVWYLSRLNYWYIFQTWVYLNRKNLNELLLGKVADCPNDVPLFIENCFCLLHILSINCCCSIFGMNVHPDGVPKQRSNFGLELLIFSCWWPFFVFTVLALKPFLLLLLWLPYLPRGVQTFYNGANMYYHLIDKIICPSPITFSLVAIFIKIYFGNKNCCMHVIIN